MKKQELLDIFDEVQPDVLMIDGGKGQLSSAVEVLESEGFHEIQLISIAKRFEWLYTPGAKDPIRLEKDSPALRLLMKIRDEAHRFAISYHRKLRQKALSHSFLDDIPGIGEKRKRVVLQRFSTRDELARVDIKELAALPGMNRQIATKILCKVLSS